jgi:hypothetical protein
MVFEVTERRMMEYAGRSKSIVGMKKGSCIPLRRPALEGGLRECEKGPCSG